MLVVPGTEHAREGGHGDSRVTAPGGAGCQQAEGREGGKGREGGREGEGEREGGREGGREGWKVRNEGDQRGEE